ncbi:MAG: hypothetical protein R3E08_09645 [Thiotrichaceae bacterium]
MNIPKLELKTDREIQQLAYTVLIRELGIVGFIQFIQSFDPGTGDYTKEREQWQAHLTVDSIVQMIQEDNRNT